VVNFGTEQIRLCGGRKDGRRRGPDKPREPETRYWFEPEDKATKRAVKKKPAASVRKKDLRDDVLGEAASKPMPKGYRRNLDEINQSPDLEKFFGCFAKLASPNVPPAVPLWEKNWANILGK
jgi:hypothetical protein